MDQAVRGDPATSPADGVDLRSILALLSKWRWVIMILTGVAVLTAGFLAFFVLPKVYQATATVDVSYAAPDQGQGGSPLTSQGLQGVIQSVATLPQNTLQTYQWQVTNPVVLQATSTALAARGVSLTPAQLQQMVKPSVVTNTNLVGIAVTDTSPSVAALVANTLTTVYLTSVQAQDHSKLTQAVGFLQGQAQAVASRLHAATVKLTAAESAAGPAAASQLQADEQQLQTLQGQLTEAQVQLQSAQAGLSTVQLQLHGVAPTIGAATAVRSVRPNPVYQTLAQQAAADAVTVAQDKAIVAALQAAATAAGTTVAKDGAQPVRNAAALQGAVQNWQSLQSQLTQARVQLQSGLAGQAAVAQQMKGLDSSETVTTLPASGNGGATPVQANPTYQTLSAQLATERVAVAQDQATVTALQAAQTTLQGQVSNLAARTEGDQANVQALQSQVQELTSTYQTLMSNLTQAQVADAMSLGSTVVTLAASATVPLKPIKPNKKLDLALALVLGLVVSVGLAFLLEQLDNTVKTPEDIERLVGVPTLAVIPHFGE